MNELQDAQCLGLDETLRIIVPNTVVWLLVLLAINIGMMVLKFYLDWRHGKNDIRNYKSKKISEKAIDVESEIYSKLLELSILQKEDIHTMLNKIQDLDTYIEVNSLYISKKYRNRVDDASDYFKKVLTSYSKKDNKKENEIFKKLSKAFYGE